MYQCITLWLIITVILTLCVGHQLQIETENHDDGSANITTTKADFAEDVSNGFDKQTNIAMEVEKIDALSNETTSMNSAETSFPLEIHDSTLSSQLSTNSSLNASSLIVTINDTNTTVKASTTLTKKLTTESSINFLELTTKTLSLTNKSSLSSAIVTESIKSSLIKGSRNSSNVDGSNSKSSRQRSNLNNVLTKTNSSISKSQQKSTKIETPTLNHLFNIHNIYKNHHHRDRYGPHFETGNITNITVQVGNTFYLHCRISLLQDKTVSWVRRKQGVDGLELLTVGKQKYSGDERYSLDFQYPNNWRLKIVSAQKIDEGTYECQISTHPPRIIQYNVHINAPEVTIVDEHGLPLYDKYYEVESTIRLTCIVRHLSMMSSNVLWSHGDDILNYDVTRGGISVKTDLMEIGANSTLSVARVNKTDSGNYTCSIGPHQYYTVLVHVLNESLAELHHSGCTIVSPLKYNSISYYFLHLLAALLIINYIQCHPVR